MNILKIRIPLFRFLIRQYKLNQYKVFFSLFTLLCPEKLFKDMFPACVNSWLIHPRESRLGLISSLELGQAWVLIKCLGLNPPDQPLYGECTLACRSIGFTSCAVTKPVKPPWPTDPPPTTYWAFCNLLLELFHVKRTKHEALSHK